MSQFNTSPNKTATGARPAESEAVVHRRPAQRETADAIATKRFDPHQSGRRPLGRGRPSQDVRSGRRAIIHRPTRSIPRFWKTLPFVERKRSLYPPTLYSARLPPFDSDISHDTGVAYRRRLNVVVVSLVESCHVSAHSRGLCFTTVHVVSVVAPQGTARRDAGLNHWLRPNR